MLFRAVDADGQHGQLDKADGGDLKAKRGGHATVADFAELPGTLGRVTGSRLVGFLD